jgi:cytochrome c553
VAIMTNNWVKPIVALGMMALGFSLALAQNPEKPKEQAEAGKVKQTVNQVCAACHGADGNSAIPANPNLAGQHAHYTTKQLADFKSGARKNAVMSGMVAALTPEDMTGLAAYFAEQKPKPSVAKDKSLVALGEKIYRGGNSDTGVPACAGCHSPTGAGIPIQFPRLAGQFADYTFAQLKAFRAGERTNDNANVMQSIAAKMSEQEMRAVAEYTAGLRAQLATPQTATSPAK